MCTEATELSQLECFSLVLREGEKTKINYSGPKSLRKNTLAWKRDDSIFVEITIGLFRSCPNNQTLLNSFIGPNCSCPLVFVIPFWVQETIDLFLLINGIFYCYKNLVGQVEIPTYSYVLDVLWGQQIKLIQVVSTSEFHAY